MSILGCYFSLFFLLFIGVVADLFLISGFSVVLFRVVAWISFSFINIYILPLKKIQRVDSTATKMEMK